MREKWYISTSRTLFQKWNICPALRYSALFHFSSEASLGKDQYSEREAAPASPLFLGPDECVCVQCRPTTPISSAANARSPWQPHLLNRWEEHANPATLEQWLMPDGAWVCPRFTSQLRRRCAAACLRRSRGQRDTEWDKPERKSCSDNTTVRGEGGSKLDPRLCSGKLSGADNEDMQVKKKNDAGAKRQQSLRCRWLKRMTSLDWRGVYCWDKQLTLTSTLHDQHERTRTCTHAHTHSQSLNTS